MEKSPVVAFESAEMQFVPCIRSGSFADIGPRRYMEDEHIRMDDLSSYLGSLLQFPTPSAFYGVIHFPVLYGLLIVLLVYSLTYVIMLHSYSMVMEVLKLRPLSRKMQ